MRGRFTQHPFEVVSDRGAWDYVDVANHLFEPHFSELNLW